MPRGKLKETRANIVYCFFLLCFHIQQEDVLCIWRHGDALK